MARPQYIICSQGRSVDRASGLLSVFQVLEHLTVTIKTIDEDGQPQKTVPQWNMLVSCCWMRDEHDSDEDVFEHELVVSHAGADAKLETPVRQEFQFQPKKWLQRFDITIIGAVPTCGGILTLKSRVKPKSSDDGWKEQEYRIPVVVDDKTTEEDTE